jgi:septal ring factor EnvC (AmiA/AmiB activator)
MEKMKTKQELHNEACESLEKKISSLYKEIAVLTQELIATEKLRYDMDLIYE